MEAAAEGGALTVNMKGLAAHKRSAPLQWKAKGGNFPIKQLSNAFVTIHGDSSHLNRRVLTFAERERKLQGT